MVLRVFRTSNRNGENTPPCKNARLIKTIEERYSTEYIWEIDINTIEDIMSLIHETNYPLVILDKDIEDEEDGPTIEIYDGYRE